MGLAVLTEVAHRIGFITLNRPDKRNALSPDLIQGLKEAFEEMRDREDVKLIILRANGKAFCSGADLGYLQAMQQFTYEENLEDSTKLKDLFSLIYTLPKVVIAQIQGHALAGGCGLVTVCDFSFSVSTALFGYTEVKIGFVPALVSVFLREKIGGAKTLELLLSGDLITAAKASELGLITGVAGDDSLEKEVMEFAEKLIRQNSGFSMGETKKLIRALSQDLRESNLKIAAEINANARAHEDCRKGISTFLNKTESNW
jgi:methylglutaconyl-CoA hydratase